MREELPLEAALRQKRVAAGYNQSEAAAKAGLSRRSLTRWESGAARPRVDELQRLLTVLEVTRAERESLLDKLGTPAALKELRRSERDERVFPPPHQGDLLRALRLRQGLRQEDLAPRLGVSQATLARWETGANWPSDATIHQICFLLQAREEEFAALCQRRYFAVESLRDGRRLDRDELEHQLEALEKSLSDPYFYGLGDLLFLSLEARAASLFHGDDDGRVLIARILMGHAKYLSQRCQPIEAGRTALTALRLLPRVGERWNNLRLEGELYFNVWKRPLREHARHLQHWLGRPLDLRYRTWVMGQIGAALLEQGEHDEALAIDKRALTLTQQQGTPAAVIAKTNSYAETLLEIGRAAQAAELFQLHEGMALPMRIRHQLNLAEAHLANGNRMRAHDWVQSAQAENSVLGIDYYLPQMNSLLHAIHG